MEVLVPTLADGIGVGVLAYWRVSPGDRVHEGEVIALVLIDHTHVDVRAPQSGIIEELLVTPGYAVRTGMGLAHLVPEIDLRGPRPLTPPEVIWARTPGARPRRTTRLTPVAPVPPPSPAAGTGQGDA